MPMIKAQALPACGLLVAGLYLLLNGLPLPLDELSHGLLVQLRLPLLLCAAVVGACLSLSAAMLQVSLRNPLADPGIIGISSGASLCAAIFLLTPLGDDLVYGLPLFSFIGAMLSSLLIYAIARRYAGGQGVILAGIALSTLAGAMIAWLYFYADAQSLRNLTFWLMGSLHQADWPQLRLALPLALILLVLYSRQGQRLNLLYFSPLSAAAAGLDAPRFERFILLGAALMVGLAVSLAGSIAFVGLLVPHLLRLWLGHDNRLILPASALYGALLMVLVALASGGLNAVALPVSMLTATLGGPVFFYALLKGGRVRAT